VLQGDEEYVCVCACHHTGVIPGNLGFRNSAPRHPSRPPRPPHSGNSIWMQPALQRRLFLPLPPPSVYPVVLLRIHRDLSFTLRHSFFSKFLSDGPLQPLSFIVGACLCVHLARIISLGPAAFRNTYFGFNIIGMHVYYYCELFLLGYCYHLLIVDCLTPVSSRQPLNSWIMCSLAFLDDIMATRTCNNCRRIDVKQQTVMSDGNGNKGRGFFAVSKQAHHSHSWLNS